MIFDGFRRRMADARTLAFLCEAAEQLALARGQAAPGSEHFVLAALKMPEGSASHAFNALGIGFEAFSQALAALDERALADFGIDVSSVRVSVPVAPPPPRLYDSQPSAQLMMQRLAEARHARVGRPIMGADVLLAVADEQLSASARAMQALGVSASRLQDAARLAIHGVQQ